MSIPVFSTAVSFSASVALTTLFHVYAPKYLPIPPRHLQIEDKKKQLKSYRRYLAIWTSTVHGIMCIIFSTLLLWRDGITYDEPNMPEHYILMALSAGYYCVDFLAGIKWRFAGATMTIHHTVMLILLSYVIFRQRYGGMFTYFIFIGELSNPCMHVRKNLQQFDGTRVYTDILGTIFCITFIICRVFMAAYVAEEIFDSSMCLAFKSSLITLWYISLELCFTVVEFFCKGMGNLIGSSLLLALYEQIKGIRESTVKSWIKHGLLIWFTYWRLLRSKHHSIF